MFKSVSGIQEWPMNPRKRYTLLILLIVLLLAGFGGYKAWQYFKSQADLAHRAEIQSEIAAKIEDEWGIRIIHVALVAEGGLMDLRYQVTDPDKAYDLFDEVDYVPRIISEDRTVMGLNDSPHTHNLVFGQYYFFIIRNENDSVKPGSYVSVAVGEYELPYVKVES